MESAAGSLGYNCRQQICSSVSLASSIASASDDWSLQSRIFAASVDSQGWRKNRKFRRAPSFERTFQKKAFFLAKLRRGCNRPALLTAFNGWQSAHQRHALAVILKVAVKEIDDTAWAHASLPMRMVWLCCSWRCRHRPLRLPCCDCQRFRHAGGNGTP